jgi:hypothetical protein
MLSSSAFVVTGPRSFDGRLVVDWFFHVLPILARLPHLQASAPSDDRVVNKLAKI